MTTFGEPMSIAQLRIGIIACGAVVREMTAIARRQGWHYELTAIPAQLHNRPARIAPAVKERLEAWAERYDLILVGYGDCGTQGALDELLADYPHAVRIDSPHCYEFFGGAAFAQQMAIEPGSFFLTDFLARHFDGLVWRGLGLDRFPELQAIYFGNYRQVVYLRQTQEPESARALTAHAEAAAARLLLPLKVVDAGLSALEVRLVEIVTRRALQLGRAKYSGTSCNSTLSTPSLASSERLESNLAAQSMPEPNMPEANL